MKLTTTILFAFVELMVVINSSYSYTYRRTYIQDRNRPKINIAAQCGTPVLRNGSFRLRQRGKLIRYRCAPDFTLIGNQYSSCEQGQWDSPVPMCIKPGCPVLSAPENGNTLIDENGALTMLFCYPGYALAGSQETFCDGIQWDRSLGSCRETQASPAMSCDFEVSSICGWEPDPTHDFEWIRKNGYSSIRRLQTGPKHDHTVGIPLEGHFMLATFATKSPNSVARILSPLYPAAASKEACFRFYYHMYGAITGVLRVYIKPKSITIAEMLESTKYFYMEKNGSDENTWLESVFEIDEYDQDFQIIIEATAVRTTRSNIAIDDVALLNGADCVNEELKSTTVTSEEGGIFDAQSCVNRCDETSSHSQYVTESTITSSNKTVNILQCDCFDGCVDAKSCCLDYESVCVFDLSTVSTDMEVDTEVATLTNALLSSSSTTISTPTAASTSTLKPTVASVPTSNVTQTTKTIPKAKTNSTTTTLKPTSTTRIITTVETIKTTPTTKSIPTTKTVPTTTKVIPTTKTVPTTTKTIPTTKTVPTTTKTIPTTKTVPTTTKTIPTTKTVPTTKNISTRIPYKPTTATVKLVTPSVKSTSIKSTTTPKTPTTKVLASKGTTLATIKKTGTVLPPKLTTSFVAITPTRKADTTVPANGSKGEWNAVNVSPDSDPLPTNLLNVFGFIFLSATIIALLFVVFKFYQKHQNHRFNYKSKSKRYSGDVSDEVRFLTADEQLDFSMQCNADDRYR